MNSMVLCVIARAANEAHRNAESAIPQARENANPVQSVGPGAHR